MVNKQGSYTAKLPTQVKSNKKNKNVSIDHTQELRKCPNCSKRRMLIKYQYKNPENGLLYKYSRCANCEYSNYIPL